MELQVCRTVFFVSLFLKYNNGKMVDMTHYLEKRILYWPGHGPFKMSPIHQGPIPPFEWVAYNEIHMPEHIGTHLDAPNHFVKNGKFIGDIPLTELVGPGVVIDNTHRARYDRDAPILVRDIEEWEERNGRIPDGAVVLQNSGWEKYWHEQNATAYLGFSKPVPEDSKPSDWDMHSPGFSKEAAEFLAYQRNIKMVGVDTVNGDIGNDHTFPVHGVLLTKDILIVENVKNVGRIPEVGATIYVMPINIRQGTGAPVRMFATWDEEPLVGKNEHSTYSSATKVTFHGILLGFCMLIFIDIYIMIVLK